MEFEIANRAHHEEYGNVILLNRFLNGDWRVWVEKDYVSKRVDVNYLVTLDEWEAQQKFVKFNSHLMNAFTFMEV